MKKKILAFVMVIMLLCPMLVFFTLTVHKKVVQHQMEEKIEHTSLQKIVLTKGSFVWIKMNKEILVDGKMFDVKSYSVNSDKIIFTGLFDEDEKKIIDDLNVLIHYKKKSSLPVQQLLKILLTPTLFEEGNSYATLETECIKKEYFFYSETAVTQATTLTIPPPNN